MSPRALRLLRVPYVAYATVVLYSLHFAWTALWTLVVLLGALVRSRRLMTLVVSLWSRGIFWLVFRRVRVEGAHHIDPARTYIVAANHTSMYDIPALMSLFPRVAWLGRAKLLGIPVFGAALKAIDYIPIWSGDPQRNRESIRRAVEKSPPVSIALFPEGTRTLDGRLGPFKKGFTYIVEDTTLDVLPVTIRGLFAWKPKHQWVLSPLGPVSLVVHPPITNTAMRAMDREAMCHCVREQILSALESER